MISVRLDLKPQFDMPSFQSSSASDHLQDLRPFCPTSNHNQGQYAQFCTTRQDMAYSGSHSWVSQSQMPAYNGGQYMGAPMLPPLRPRNDSVIGTEHLQRLKEQNRLAQQAQQQEEQPIGGISAKLDYDLEYMTDFVASSAQSMYAFHLSQICLADIDLCRSIQGGTHVPLAFRKWVNQVLTATRLPSATILLSLHYMAVRLREHSDSVGSSEQHVYRLLAVAMILGSKFLDDNTFINRSWSDVSGIKVTELNVLEIEWLALIGFDLHANVADPNGVGQWIHAWREFEGQMNEKSQRLMCPPDYPAQAQHFPQQLALNYQPVVLGSNGYITPASSNSSPLYAHRYMSADPWNQTNKSFDRHDDRSHTSSRHDSAASTQAPTPEQSRGNVGLQYRQVLPAPHQLNAQAFFTPWNQYNWHNASPSHGFPAAYPQAYASYMPDQSFAPRPVIA